MSKSYQLRNNVSVKANVKSYKFVLIIKSNNSPNFIKALVFRPLLLSEKGHFLIFFSLLVTATLFLFVAISKTGYRVMPLQLAFPKKLLESASTEVTSYHFRPCPSQSEFPQSDLLHI